MGRNILDAQFHNQIEQWLAQPEHLPLLKRALYPLARTHSLAVGYAPDEATDELFAEVCRIALAKADAYKPDRTLDVRFYLLGIGRNVVLRWQDAHQKTKRRTVSFSEKPETPADSDQEAEYFAHSLDLGTTNPLSLENKVVGDDWVSRLMNRLPLLYREVLTLHLMEDQSSQEIASALQITPVAVRVRISRGLKMLRLLHDATENPQEQEQAERIPPSRQAQPSRTYSSHGVSQ